NKSEYPLYFLVQLLTEIDELIDGAKENKVMKAQKLKDKEKDDMQLAKTMRDQALGVTPKEQGCPGKPSKKQRRSNDDSALVAILSERNKIRLQELETRRLEAENQAKMISNQQAAHEDMQRILLQLMQNR